MRRFREKGLGKAEAWIEQKLMSKLFVSHSRDNNCPSEHFRFPSGMRLSWLALVPSGIRAHKEC